jgi:hypothetical protein
MMNVIMTQSPDGMVNGKQIGFSLDPTKMTSLGETKTESEVIHLLKQAGVWSEGVGVNKEEVRRRLSAGESGDKS